MALETVNPATGKLVKRFEEWTLEKTLMELEKTARAWPTWANRSFPERAAVLFRTAEVLRQKKEQLAQIMTLEMGKPVAEGRAETEKCAWVCDYYAENGEKFLALETIESDASRSYVAFRPLGTILAIMPWNFPLWQVFRFAAPALMAGNACVLKHSSNVPQCALAIQNIFEEGGLPNCLFTTLMIGSGKVDEVIASPYVQAISLTGSDHAGREVAATAGKRLKKTVLELGGSDPFIVLDDADLEEAAKVAAQARCINSGQSCIAAKRFVVVEEVYDLFLEHFKKEMEKLPLGDPCLESTRIGPLARQDLVDELHEQVRTSVEHGARVLLGGQPLEGEGFYYPATILVDVEEGMPAYDQETFGPVATVIKAKDARQAISIANSVPFGLGASLWTKDLDRAEEYAASLQCGAVFFNGLVKSDPRLPFGGVKLSGYGRELSHYGIREFVNIQTVWQK
ncbi:MAG: NAD-dependent succinate-semialdehyde dehydrogenase [Deltaproteobacteria bacterium]|nr:NAD-dependent succinate-semialdehyde dehydrogenase [Deltaproteobacteria bacterium]